MSPEQARGEAVDHRSDLFSLGSVLYAMCVGHAPFRASTTMGVIKRVCDEAPRPIRELNPDVPDWLVAIIDKLLAKNAAERFASAKDVAELLGQCLAHLQQPATVSLPEKLASRSSRTERLTPPPTEHALVAAATVARISVLHTARGKLFFGLGLLAGMLTIGWLVQGVSRPVPGPAGAFFTFACELGLLLVAAIGLLAGIVIGSRRFIRGLDTTTSGGRLWGTALSGALLATVSTALLVVTGAVAVYWQSRSVPRTETARLTFNLAGPQIAVTLNGEPMGVSPSGNVSLRLTPGEYVIAHIKRGQPEMRSGETLHPGQHKTVRLNESQADAVQISGPLVLAYGPGATAPSVADYILLQGRWQIVSQERNGVVSSPAQRGDWIEFDRGYLRFDLPATPRSLPFPSESLVSLYAHETPARIDVLNVGAKGIYKLGRDTLTLAIADAGQPRPTEFVSRPASAVTLTVCRRATNVNTPTTADDKRWSASNARRKRNASTQTPADDTASVSKTPAGPAAESSNALQLVHSLAVGAGAWSVFASPDGKWLAATGEESAYRGLIKMWDTDTFASKITIQQKPGIRQAAFTHDSQQLVTVNDEGLVKVFDLAVGKYVAEFEALAAAVTCLAVSRDGRRIATGHKAGAVVLWDFAERKAGQILSGHSDEIRSAAFSPDGTRLASGGLDRIVRVWDVETGKLLFIFSRAADRIEQVAFSPDGASLAAASWDKIVWICDATTGEDAGPLRGHTDKLTSLAWSPDGKLIATGCFDGTMLVFNRETGHIVARADAKQNQVFGVAFLDNERLASAHRNGVVNVWQLRP